MFFRILKMLVRPEWNHWQSPTTTDSVKYQATTHWPSQMKYSTTTYFIQLRLTLTFLIENEINYLLENGVNLWRP